MRQPICLTKVPRLPATEVPFFLSWRVLSLLYLEAPRGWRSSSVLSFSSLSREIEHFCQVREPLIEKERGRDRISMYTNYRTQRSVLLSESNATPTRRNRTERASCQGDRVENLVHIAGSHVHLCASLSGARPEPVVRAPLKRKQHPFAWNSSVHTARNWGIAAPRAKVEGGT